MSGLVDVNDISCMPKVGPVDANHKKDLNQRNNGIQFCC